MDIHSFLSDNDDDIYLHNLLSYIQLALPEEVLTNDHIQLLGMLS